MALPKLEQPTYEIKMPSDGKAVKFRPFTVKERSILLLALQDGKQEVVLNAIGELFKVCTFGACELDKMPIVDAEFLFIHIRNKSVGEELEVVHTCDCGKANDVMMSMDKIEVEGSNIARDIKVGEKSWIKMTYPTFKNSAVMSDNPTEDEVLTVIATCIDTIINGDEVFKAKDNTLADLKEFVLGLTQPQLNAIEDFFAALPKVVIRTQYTCKCGAVHDIKIEGLENFFD